jgi:hypothetical protein
VKPMLSLKPDARARLRRAIDRGATHHDKRNRASPFAADESACTLRRSVGRPHMHGRNQRAGSESGHDLLLYRRPLHPDRDIAYRHVRFFWLYLRSPSVSSRAEKKRQDRHVTGGDSEVDYPLTPRVGVATGHLLVMWHISAPLGAAFLEVVRDRK